MKRNVMIVIAFLLLFSMQMSAQTFSAQGVLRDVLGKTVDDGSYQLNFKLYEQATGGGAEIWSETQSNVEIIHGVFSIELGSVTSLDDVPFDTTYWIGVAVAGGTEMTPRLKLTRAPSAMSLYSSANVIPLIGNIGIGTHDPEAALHIKTSDDTYDKLLIEGADGTDYIRVTADGKMALNVETPTQALDIDGDIRIRNGGIIFADSSILRSADMGGAASAISNAESAPIIADADEDSTGTIELKIGDSTKVRIHNDGNTTFYGDLTAAKLIDSDSSDFYADPASGSKLNLLGVNGGTASTDYPLSINGAITGSKIVRPEPYTSYCLDPNGSSKIGRIGLGGFDAPTSMTLNIDGDIDHQSGTLKKNGATYNTSIWEHPDYGIRPPSWGEVRIDGGGYYTDTGGALVVGDDSGDPGSVLLTTTAYDSAWDSASDSVTFELNHPWGANLHIKARYGQGLEFYVNYKNEREFNCFEMGRIIYMSNSVESGESMADDGLGLFKDSDVGNLGSSSAYWSEAHAQTIYRDNEYTLSDRRVKRNIEDLSNSLDKLLALRGVRYEINRATHPFYKDRTLRKAEELPVKLGFIAQELQDVIPEMVEFNEDYQLYTIRNYEQMLPVVVAAVQELKAAKDQKIATLKDRINLLLNENRQLVKRVDNLEKN